VFSACRKISEWIKTSHSVRCLPGSNSGGFDDQRARFGGPFSHVQLPAILCGLMGGPRGGKAVK
jgi:hypothetical protein